MQRQVTIMKVENGLKMRKVRAALLARTRCLGTNAEQNVHERGEGRPAAAHFYGEHLQDHCILLNWNSTALIAAATAWQSRATTSHA